MHIQLCSLTFLKRCRDNQIVPKCFQLKYPSTSKQTKTILRQASLKLIREKISAAKNNLAQTSRKLFELHLSLSNLLKSELWETLDRITYEQAVHCAELRTKKQKEKFEKLKPRKKEIPSSTHTVKNFSNHTLTDAQLSILSKGQNFAIAPSKIPTEEIISQTETAIYHLPTDVGNDIRRKLSNILHKAKPPQQNISKKERSALQSLKNNDTIVILPADKGNATVVMNKKDYYDKIKAMLSNSSVYKKLTRDPTPGIERKTIKLLKEADISPETRKALSPKESLAPRLYGLPKIHKESIPLRPIVSNIGAPTYQLARFLTEPLQRLVGQNESYIINSLDFVNKLCSIRTGESDLLVSFDVESLFTNVPIPDTLDIIRKSNKIPTDMLPLIEHCLTSTYFQFQGEFYEQSSGAAMGSPISPIIANIFMENFESEILRSAPLKPSIWFRYVDDTFVIWKHGKHTLPQFLNFLNTQHPSIKFTMEIEHERCLPFLDVLVHRNKDGSLGHQVYRKPTHTDRYLHASSHHHPSQKNSVISSLMYRALKISQPQHLESEIKHLDEALGKNGYQKKQIHRVLQRLKNENSANLETKPTEQQEHQKVAVLPYLQGTTDRISKILRKHNIRTIFKPPTKIGQVLPNVKDRRASLSTPGVYKIPCSCGKVYIGETGRRISTRVKEHQRCAKYGHMSQSALAEHWMDTGHSIQYDKAKRVAQSQGYFARKYREGLEIHKHPNNLNRDQGFQVNPIWHAVLPVSN